MSRKPLNNWRSEDDWQTQPRKITEIGPLPAGAILERPEKPEVKKLEEIKVAKIDEIEKVYKAALAPNLTML